MEGRDVKHVAWWMVETIPAQVWLTVVCSYSISYPLSFPGPVKAPEAPELLQSPATLQMRKLQLRETGLCKVTWCSVLIASSELLISHS